MASGSAYQSSWVWRRGGNQNGDTRLFIKDAEGTFAGTFEQFWFVGQSFEQTLSPPLLTNAQTFFGPTVVNTNTISPSLLTNTETFFGPTVQLEGQTLAPSLFTDSQTFFGPTVTPGDVTVSPGLLTNPQTFYSATVTATYTLTPALFTNTQSFFGPTITTSNTLTPALFTNPQTFYTPTVTPGAMTVQPPLLTNTQTFFSPSIVSYIDVIEDPIPLSGEVLLAEIEPLDPVDGLRKTVRVTNVNIASVTALNDLIWRPAISEAARLAMRFFKGDFDGIAAAGGGNISLQLDQLLPQQANARRFVWVGASVKLWAGAIGQAWPWTQVFEGLVGDQPRTEKNRISLPLEINTEPLETDILTATYAGTGGAEGGADLKDKPKPWLLGRCFNVPPILIDATNSVFQFSAYGAISAVTKLYERGSDFGASIGDYANYAALVAAAIPEGRWATCLAAGMVRLGAPPYGVITGDVDGDAPSGTWRRKTGEIINRVAANAGATSSVNTVSFTDLDTAVAAVATSNQGRIGVFLTEQESLIDFASRLCAPCNAQVGVSLLGQMFVTRPDIGTASLTLDGQQRQMPRVIQSTETGTSPPFSRIDMGYAKSWYVHKTDEIAWFADLVERGLYDALTTYREGNIVNSTDGSRWLYTNATASSGNAPPSWPTTSNSYWENLTPPTIVAIPSVAIRAAEPTNPRDMSNVSRRLLIATDAGSSVTISVARHDWDYSESTATVTRELGTITGLSFSTRYYVYFDDLSLTDGTVTYVATTNYETAKNSVANPGRHLVGTLRTPADGGIVTNEVDIRIAEAAVMNANDNNGQTPDAGGSITSVTKFLDHADGRVSYEATFTFPYNADPNHKNNTDGFIVGYIARDSSGAYTMLGPNNSAETWYVINQPMGAASYTLPFLQQVDPTKYYTIAYAPWRKVLPTTVIQSLGVAGRGWEIGPITQHGPFQPSATQALGSAARVGGQTPSDVGTATGRALAAITSGNKAAADVVETISLTAETVTHLFAGTTSSTEIALDGAGYGTFVSVASSSFTVQEGGADVLFTGLVSVRFGISVTDSNLQFTATARITFGSSTSNTFEVTQTVYAAGRHTTVPIVIQHLFEGVTSGSKTFYLEIKVDDPSGSGDYAETRGVRAVQILELKR